ncbi:DUF7437 domain-containing protein [Halobellus marinus]
MAARKLDLSPLGTEIIVQALEPVAIEYTNTNNHEYRSWRQWRLFMMSVC